MWRLHCLLMMMVVYWLSLLNMEVSLSHHYFMLFSMCLSCSLFMPFIYLLYMHMLLLIHTMFMLSIVCVDLQ